MHACMHVQGADVSALAQRVRYHLMVVQRTMGAVCPQDVSQPNSFTDFLCPRAAGGRPNTSNSVVERSPECWRESHREPIVTDGPSAVTGTPFRRFPLAVRPLASTAKSMALILRGVLSASMPTAGGRRRRRRSTGPGRPTTRVRIWRASAAAPPRVELRIRFFLFRRQRTASIICVASGSRMMTAIVVVMTVLTVAAAAVVAAMVLVLVSALSILSPMVVVVSGEDAATVPVEIRHVQRLTATVVEVRVQVVGRM